MEVYFGQAIKEIAEKMGFSPTDLAQKIGKTPTAVYDIYRKKDVSTSVLRQFSDVLGVPINAFFGETSLNQIANGSGNKQLINSQLNEHIELEICRKENEGLKREIAAKDKIIQLLESKA